MGANNSTHHWLATRELSPVPIPHSICLCLWTIAIHPMVDLTAVWFLSVRGFVLQMNLKHFVLFLIVSFFTIFSTNVKIHFVLHYWYYLLSNYWFLSLLTIVSFLFFICFWNFQFAKFRLLLEFLCISEKSKINIILLVKCTFTISGNWFSIYVI